MHTYIQAPHIPLPIGNCAYTHRETHTHAHKHGQIEAQLAEAESQMASLGKEGEEVVKDYIKLRSQVGSACLHRAHFTSS